MRLAKRIAIVVMVIMTAALLAAFVYADDGGTLPAQSAAETTESAESGDSSVGLKALAVGIAIGLAAAGLEHIGGGGLCLGAVELHGLAVGILGQSSTVDTHHADARPCVHRNSHNLCAAGRHTGHLRPVRR